MRGLLKYLSFAVLIFVCTIDPVWAQAIAQIGGRVTDQSGAVMPGVEITVTQTDTGISRNTITNETGTYDLTNLPIGPYRLEASLPGFRTFAQTGIVLQVNSSPNINVILEVGQVTETIEVQANAALVETRDMGVKELMDNVRVLELPLNGRSVGELIELSAGVAPATKLGGDRNPWASATGVSIAGGTNRSVFYTLDGATHIQPQDSSHGPLPFPDAMQEFQINTSATSARSGFKPGGSVAVVTKSGTNEFHGNLFEFVRNGKFNARNAFAAQRDSMKRNQFGGTIGGPIMREKMFIFAGYQATTIREAPTQELAFVPTTAMLAGDFTDFASPACNRGRQIALRAPFVNNRVDPALFSRPARTIASKLPGASDPCGTAIYGYPNRENQHHLVTRIDFQQSAKHSMFGRYLIDSIKKPSPFDLSGNILSANTQVKTDGLAQAFAFGSTYLFSSTVVNALRLSATRTAAGRMLSNEIRNLGLGPADLGIKTWSADDKLPRYTITAGFSITETAGPTRTAVFAIDDTVSVVSGNHEMGFGVNLGHWDSTSYSRTGSDANWSFSGARTGLGLADFMLGYASAFQSGMPIVHYKRSYLVGVFGTDSWRLPRNVTLTYGLRWEPYFPMRHRDGAAIHFDEEAFKKGIRSGRFDNTPPGVFFNGDPGFPGEAGIFDKWWNFTPRAGLAWDVHGDGRMSVRASAGLFYDFPNSHYMVGTAAGAPFAPRVNLTTVSFEDPWAGYPGGDPFPTGGNRRDADWPAFSQVTATEYDAPNAQTLQWNLSLQRQIAIDWMVSAAYLGSGTSHLWSVRQLNPAVYIPGVGNANGNCIYNGKVAPFTVQSGTPCSVRGNNDVRRRLYLENPETGRMYGDIPLISPTGVANYNGLLLSVQRRPARGVSVSANYTWSHCISEPAVGPGTNAYGTRGNVGWRDDNRRLDRGPCHAAAEDRRHLFNFSGVAESPQFSNRAVRAIASNWRLSPILKIGSGAPYVVYTNVDPTLTGLRMVALNQVLPNLYGDKSAGNYLNPKAFALPETGTWGNLSEGSVRGPGYWQFDVALSRNFQFREDQRLELRAEAFNVTNSVVFNHPSDTFSSGTGSQESTFESSRFGTLSSARPPRIMQFALKYFF